jgi:hypothetical protein
LDKLSSESLNSETLFFYEMTESEKSVSENFRQELIDICDGLNVPRGKLFDGSPYTGRLKDNVEFVLKFEESIGYFVVYSERGNYELKQGFPTKDREKAKLFLLESEFNSGGMQHELECRETLEIEWSHKYTIEYDSRKFWFEYTINLLNTVNNCFPDDIAIKYTKHMNKWFDSEYWYFNKNTSLFETNSN